MSGDSAGGSYGDDFRASVRLAVEIDSLAGLDVGIVAFAIAPARLLAVDHRPAQSAHVVIGVVRGEIVPVAAAEFGIFLEQPFLHVEAKRLGFAVLVAGSDFACREPVDLAVAIEHVEQRLAAIVGIGRENVSRPDFVRREAFRKFH